MRLKSGLVTITAASLILGVSGCGTSAGAPGSQTTVTSSHMSEQSTSAAAPNAGRAGAQPVLITINNFMYSVPASVAPGAKVTVKNQDSQNHTITSTMHGAFDVKIDADGGTATFTAPTRPGSYPFGCTFHANMMGTLVVR